ncbi:unnamed protein product, partial [Mesorhabditis spiculigera]
MEALPNELKIAILERVQPDDLRKFTLLNKAWRQLFKKNRRHFRRADAEEIRFHDLGDGNIQIHIVLPGNPAWTKRIVSKTVPAAEAFDCVWPYTTADLKVNSHSNALRSVFEEMPDYWLKDVSTLGIFENESNVDSLAILGRCPAVSSLYIDPCYSAIDVTSIARKMPKIEDLKLLSCNRIITADDTTLAEVIERSRKSENGLRTFWVDSIPTDFSMAMVQRFLLEAKFSERCSILLEKMRGSRAVFLDFINQHFDDTVQSGNAYNFKDARGYEFSLIIGSFIA